MGDPTAAVAAALLALAELIEVERYQEAPHAAELAQLRSSPGHAFREMREAPGDGRPFTREHCLICNVHRDHHVDPLRSAARVIEIERDHAYRAAWNLRSKIIARRISEIARGIASEPPAHASQAW